MAAHELLAYIGAPVEIILLLVLVWVGIRARRDLRRVRRLYGTLLDEIVRRHPLDDEDQPALDDEPHDGRHPV